MSGTEERGSLVECRVIKHAPYGLMLRTLPGDEPGYADSDAISDEPRSGTDHWPAVGAKVQCVVIARRRDGRLALSCRPRDVALARAAPDPVSALEAWRRVRDDGSRDPGLRSEFLASENAVPVLRWALRAPEGSPDRTLASEMVATATGPLARRVLE
jgi:hypothetical protein